MASRPRFVVGGPAYRQQVHVQHAASMMALAGASTIRGDGPLLAGVDYRHSSNLPQIRCLWLRDQIAERQPTFKWAVSVDSDTTFNANQLLHEISQVDGQIAIGLAPVRIGGTEDLCNLNLTAEDEEISATMQDGKLAVIPALGKRIKWGDDLKKVLEGDRRITSGGFGVAVFNLDWFRTCWREPEPEFCSIATGEDTEFCRSVRKRGGGIIALRVNTDHFAWGEKQTR